MFEKTAQESFLLGAQEALSEINAPAHVKQAALEYLAKTAELSDAETAAGAASLGLLGLGSYKAVNPLFASKAELNRAAVKNFSGGRLDQALQKATGKNVAHLAKTQRGGKLLRGLQGGRSGLIGLGLGGLGIGGLELLRRHHQSK